MARKKLFITGAAGNVGSGLRRHLRDQYDFRLMFHSTIPDVEPSDEVVVSDLADFELSERFALAFAAVNTFLELPSQADQLSCLSRARRHLQDSGVLILDVFNPDRMLLEGGLVLDRRLKDSAACATIVKAVSGEVERFRQLQRLTLIYDRAGSDGRIERSLFETGLRYIYPCEMELLLASSGFQVECVYGDYDLSPFADDSDRMIAVAVRSRRK